MESSPTALLSLLLPRTPLILKTALSHTLSLSPTASKWDLRTELTVNVLRYMLGPDSKAMSISKQQHLTTKDPGVKGPVWVCKVRCEREEEHSKGNLRDLVVQSVREMAEEMDKPDPKNEEVHFTIPPSAPLEAEWHGYRAGIRPNDPEPPATAALSEQEKYAKVTESMTSKTTLLYFHGGAMFLLDPSTYRPITGRLAKKSGARVFSVRYRLAPQHPFPAALLDALTAYLTLLHPPPSAPHAAIPAQEIVFGGDSAGGMLCTALLQLLLHLHRRAAIEPDSTTPPTLTFHGKQVLLPPLPAALALTSPWLDLTRSLPSIESCASFDYLPPPSSSSHTSSSSSPQNRPLIPPCDAWPADPPRADLYCEASALLHPLASPLAAPDWRGAPPVFVSLGGEMLRDEIAVFAQRVAGQGGVVRWREFEAMPHCFGMVLAWVGGARVHFEEVGGFCRGVVGGGGEGVEGDGEGKEMAMESSAQLILAKSLERRDVELDMLTGITDAQAMAYMREGKARIVERFEREKGAVGGGVEAEVRPML